MEPINKAGTEVAIISYTTLEKQKKDQERFIIPINKVSLKVKLKKKMESLNSTLPPDESFPSFEIKLRQYHRLNPSCNHLLPACTILPFNFADKQTNKKRAISENHIHTHTP